MCTCCMSVIVHVVFSRASHVLIIYASKCASTDVCQRVPGNERVTTVCLKQDK